MRQRLIFLAVAMALASARVWGAEEPVAVKTEALAGEDDKAVPTAVPTPAADMRGPVSVTRSAQGAPAFQLPDFVVTGSGERKAIARRDGQSEGLDTSGGLRASPGEKGAGKDQMATKAERSSAEDRTYTVRPDDAWLRAAYGLANTADLDAYYGHSEGPWTWSLQGGGHNTDGGPVTPGLGLAQHRDGALKGALSYDAADWGLWETQAQGQGRASRWTHAPGPDLWLSKEEQSGAAIWQGQPLGWDLGLGLSGEHGSIRIPGLGTAYAQQTGRLDLSASKNISGHTGQTLVLLDGSMESLSQSMPGLQQQSFLWKGNFRSRFEPFAHARLTLGLGLDAITGDNSEVLLGPRVEWQQRLSPAVGLHASFDTGLLVSRLGMASEDDLRLPNLKLGAARNVGNLEAGLRWQAAPSLALETRLFAKQNENSFMPDDPTRSGLWVDSNVRSYRELGVEARERWDHDGWWQELQLRFRRPELTDLPGATPTFSPTWTGRAAGGARLGRWQAWLALEGRSEESAQLFGSWTMPGALNLSAGLGYDLNDTLTAFAEGRNLTAAPWGVAPDYPDPAPYAGLGVEVRF